MNTPTLMQLNPLLCEKQRLSNPYRFHLHALPGIECPTAPLALPPIRPRVPTHRAHAAEDAEDPGRGTRGWYFAAFAALCVSTAVGVVADREIHYRRAEYQATLRSRQDRETFAREKQKYLALAAEMNARWARQDTAAAPVLQPASYVAARPAVGSRL